MEEINIEIYLKVGEGGRLFGLIIFKEIVE